MSIHYQKKNYIKIILVITFLGGLVCFHTTNEIVNFQNNHNKFVGVRRGGGILNNKFTTKNLAKMTIYLVEMLKIIINGMLQLVIK